MTMDGGRAPRDKRSQAMRTPPPDGLRASVVELGSGSYVLLSYPRRAETPPRAPVLTPAERSVARALLLGQSNAEIARLRGSSPRTIANQVAGIFRKLGVRSRAELAASEPDLWAE